MALGVPSEKGGGTVDRAEYWAERARLDAAIKRNQEESDGFDERQKRPGGQIMITAKAAPEMIRLEQERKRLVKELDELVRHWPEMAPPTPDE
jgi:hypothetical protein